MSKETQKEGKMQHPFSETLREGEGPNLDKKTNKQKKTKKQEGKKQLMFMFP